MCPSESDLEKCKRYKFEKSCVIREEDKIRKEIFKNGPVIGFILPYKEALIYSSGIFNTMGREGLKGYVQVKVVGWGVDKNEEGENDEFWIIDPMWGSDFGINGTMKIQRKKEDLFLDQWAVTFTLSKE